MLRRCLKECSDYSNFDLIAQSLHKKYDVARKRQAVTELVEVSIGVKMSSKEQAEGEASSCQDCQVHPKYSREDSYC